MSKFASPSEAYIISQNIRYSQLAGIYADGTPTPQNIRLLDILNTIANEYNIPKQAFIDAQLKRYSELADIYAIATPIPQNIPQIDLLNEIATEYNIPNKDFINAQLTKYSQSIGMPIILKSKFNPPDQSFIDQQRSKFSGFADRYATRKPIPRQEDPSQTISGTAAKGNSSNYTSYNIAQLQTAYKFNGIQNQTFNTKPIIAIVMFNSYSKLQSDFDLFCQANNLPPYTLNIIPIDNPPNDNDAGAEQCIDTQMAYGMCPNADIIVVQSTSASIQDLAVAIQVANTYNPHVISMSWGTIEFDTETSVNQEDLFKGNTLYIASSGDTNVLQWPSVSPNVLAVGATTLYTNTDGSISSQSTWSGTGCGHSNYFTMPNYQAEYTDSPSISRNAVDLSSVGNPSTGVQVYHNGKIVVYGGTSVSAPIMAGLMGIANGIRLNNGQEIINSSSTSNLGVQNILYSNYASNGGQLFYDVVSGTSGVYPATIGWDIPTGLGTPYGEECVNFLANFTSTGSTSTTSSTSSSTSTASSTSSSTTSSSSSSSSTSTFF